ncbi:hypothetical protein [Chryseobacterium sp. MFBS3-17]|uniref:hypothetical protein n=1 Tax=Chryseobacterium sp. MFBS3-17 TaxID=2886689 RepID=UPI001D0DD038|nr:hypothetical protein [Chryseobacterium sp. MFBS3-17]MCC2590806.1 hypothetical protein [Chryseobacterium sp. MFBS3-17]
MNNETLEAKETVTVEDINDEGRLFSLNKISNEISNDELRSYFTDIISNDSYGDPVDSLNENDRAYINQMNNYTELPFEEMTNQIQNTLNEVNQSDSENKNVLTLYGEMLISSSRYFLIEGGGDKLLSVFDKYKVESANRRVGGGPRAQADGTAAAGGFLGLAVVGAAVALSGGVLAPVALLGIVVSAGFASFVCCNR